QFMDNTFGSTWHNFGTLIYHATIQVATLFLTFSICNNLSRWYNENKQTKIHPNLSGMVGVSVFFIASLSIHEATSIQFQLVGVANFFSAIIISLIVTEIYIHLLGTNRINRVINDAPDTIIPLSLASIVPVFIIIFGFAGLRILLSYFGVVESISVLINSFLQTPFLALGQTVTSALLYTIVSQVMWFFGIHGQNVLADVAQNVFVQTATSEAGSIISKTFFNAFIFMGGSGATLGLLIALFLFSRS